MPAIETLNQAIQMLGMGFDVNYVAASLQVPPDYVRNVQRNYAGDIKAASANPLDGFAVYKPRTLVRIDPKMTLLQKGYVTFSRCISRGYRAIRVMIDEPNKAIAVIPTNEPNPDAWNIDKNGTVHKRALYEKIREMYGADMGTVRGQKVGDATVFYLKGKST